DSQQKNPLSFALSQNHPNPFNPSTKIDFALSQSSYVTFQIYDILGRKVRTLVSQQLSSGQQSVIWDGKNDAGKDIASGIYFYQLRIGDFSESKKMLLLK
ncbi:MAG: T9SS type A sorting domain-containing protein, partial [Candidatus Zixiibacteriota bacterium]